MSVVPEQQILRKILRILHRNCIPSHYIPFHLLRFYGVRSLTCPIYQCLRGWKKKTTKPQNPTQFNKSSSNSLHLLLNPTPHAGQRLRHARGLGTSSLLSGFSLPSPRNTGHQRLPSMIKKLYCPVFWFSSKDARSPAPPGQPLPLPLVRRRGSGR